MIKNIKINKYGDIVCPNCSLNIITPVGAILKEGRAKCPKCNNQFKVTKPLAELANEIKGYVV